MSLKRTAIIAVVGASILAGASAAQVPAGAPDEAPVEIPAIEGEWVDPRARPAPFGGAGSPALWYQAQIRPRLTRDLLRIECMFDGWARIEVTGLIPAQRFPQPAISLRVGDRRWSATPNALYTPRSEATPQPRIPQSQLDDNLKGRDISWPGHPPFASLRFVTQRDNPLVQALAAGAPIEVEFEGQQRRFPAVPSPLAERFVRACAAVRPF